MGGWERVITEGWSEGEGIVEVVGGGWGWDGMRWSGKGVLWLALMVVMGA